MLRRDHAEVVEVEEREEQRDGRAAQHHQVGDGDLLAHGRSAQTAGGGGGGVESGPAGGGGGGGGMDGCVPKPDAQEVSP